MGSCRHAHVPGAIIRRAVSAHRQCRIDMPAARCGRPVYMYGQPVEHRHRENANTCTHVDAHAQGSEHASIQDAMMCRKK